MHVTEGPLAPLDTARTSVPMSDAEFDSLLGSAEFQVRPLAGSVRTLQAFGCARKPLCRLRLPSRHAHSPVMFATMSGAALWQLRPWQAPQRCLSRSPDHDFCCPNAGPAGPGGRRQRRGARHRRFDRAAGQRFCLGRRQVAGRVPQVTFFPAVAATTGDDRPDAVFPSKLARCAELDANMSEYRCKCCDRLAGVI